ncbi:mandelate racemase/muconate lactonizing enzyme family protein [Marinobacter bohaiensis]|uniref:mandelate racemase/muconate lactonizing enzyme family protein n=1 Tax=Marinobacter bohaiensis TaxID=2201898 RepID=UPI000DADEE41|nr:mandelate racemase/muconate lactonizing enzyme family protein [Marinobacter bohaiensis]
MRIERLTLYTAELHYAGAAYAFAGGRSYRAFTSSVVTLTTDDGRQGFGEVCPCGPNYMPAFAGGMPSCLEQLAPAVLGADPRQTLAINARMDQALCGHAYAKAAIDLACWDLLGKSAGVPVYILLGGLLSDAMPLHRIVPLADADSMTRDLAGFRADGFRHFQIKLGHAMADDGALLRELAVAKQPDEIWVGDVNGAWRRDEALRFSRSLADLDIYLEQPCASYEACRSVRRLGCHPVKLDESINSLADVRRALEDDAMDAMSLKVSKFGGLTRSRVIRDLCVDAGIPLTIEDAWGSGIATAAYAHLAASTPPSGLLNTTDLHGYNTVQLATGAPQVSDGRMVLSDRAGLGVEPDFSVLGQPVRQWPA